MPGPLLGLAASFILPFIPKIINSIAGADDEATARHNLMPHYNAMVERFVGSGMSRNQATAAAEEGIQGALHEAMGKELLPPWVDDAASIASIATGIGAVGGLKVLSAGAKLAGAKMAQGGARLAGKAAKMEETANRINGITARGADPVRNAGLGKQIAKPAPAKSTFVSNALSQEEEGMASMINRAEVPKPAAASKSLGQDDIDELIKQATSPVSAAQTKGTLMRPLGPLEAPGMPRTPRYQQEAMRQKHESLSGADETSLIEREAELLPPETGRGMVAKGSRKSLLEQDRRAMSSTRSDDTIEMPMDGSRTMTRRPQTLLEIAEPNIDKINAGSLRRPFPSRKMTDQDANDLTEYIKTLRGE